MSQVEQLQREINEAKRSLETCNSQVDGITNDLKIAITTGASERDVDELQSTRDSLSRKRERLQLHVQALEERLPEAQKADARERLPILVKALKSQSKSLSESYSNLAVVIQTLEKAVSDIEEAQKAAADYNHIAEGIDALCQQHGLERPAVPTLPEFPHALISRNWTRMGRLPLAQQRLEEHAGCWKPRMTKAERDYLAGVGPRPKQAA